MKEICERLLNDVFEASCRLADESDYEENFLPRLQNINTFLATIIYYWDNLPEDVQSDIMSEYLEHQQNVPYIADVFLSRSKEL